MSSRNALVRRRSRAKLQDYRNVNEQQVEDITLEYFYKPHTLSLLAILLVSSEIKINISDPLLGWFAIRSVHEVKC